MCFACAAWLQIMWPHGVHSQTSVQTEGLLKPRRLAGLAGRLGLHFATRETAQEAAQLKAGGSDGESWRGHGSRVYGCLRDMRLLGYDH